MGKKASVFSQSTNKQKLAIRKKAYKLWADNPDNNTKIRLSRIGKEVGMTTREIYYYKVKDKWEERHKKTSKVINEELEKQQKNISVERKESFDKIEQILNDSGLNEKHRLFVIYYLQTFNATMAAFEAGFSACKSNWALMNDERIKKAIKDIRAVIHEEIYVTGHDVLNNYIKIAFSDMTKFVEVKDNKLKLKDSNQIDGSLIQEIKQGRDGVTIKLHDKMKALDKLERLFELIPDKKLELEREKFEFNKETITKGIKEGKNITIIDDVGIG